MSASEPVRVLIVLGVPDVGVSRLAAMLGCHPQMVSLPDLALGLAERLEDLLHMDTMSADGLADGLLRAVAWCFGGRDDETGITWARKWLDRRASWSSQAVLSAFAERAAPAGIVAPAVAAGWRVIWLRRLLAAAPGAGFVHLMQHPVTQCAALARYLREAGFVAPDYKDYGARDWPRIDPQIAWYRINGNIHDALAMLPAERVWRLHREDLEAEPEEQLERLLRHFSLARDARALEAALHPERSPFAVPGPPSARAGSDAAFLKDPAFHRQLRPRRTLDDTITWRDDRDRLADEVIALARGFGYR